MFSFWIIECGICSGHKSLQAKLSYYPYLIFRVTISSSEALSNNNSGQKWVLDVYWWVYSWIKKKKKTQKENLSYM